MEYYETLRTQNHQFIPEICIRKQRGYSERERPLFQRIWWWEGKGDKGICEEVSNGVGSPILFEKEIKYCFIADSDNYNTIFLDKLLDKFFIENKVGIYYIGELSDIKLNKFTNIWQRGYIQRRMKDKNEIYNIKQYTFIEQNIFKKNLI